MVEATGAEVVLSSTWRETPALLLSAKDALGAAGLAVVGCTPRLSVLALSSRSRFGFEDRAFSAVL